MYKQAGQHIQIQDADKSIEILNKCYGDVETRYDDLLRKNLKDNETKIKLSKNKGQEYLQILTKQHEMMESEMKNIKSIRNKFEDQIQNIKSLIMNNRSFYKENSYSKTTGLENLRDFIDGKLSILHKDLISADFMKNLKRDHITHISKYFKMIMEDITNEMIPSNNQQNSLNIDKILKIIQEVESQNRVILTNSEVHMTSIKKLLDFYHIEYDSSYSTYIREDKHMKENFDLIKNQLSNMTRDIRNIDLASNLTTTQKQILENPFQNFRKNLSMFELTISNCEKLQNKKNTLIGNMKEGTDTILKKFGKVVNELENAFDNMKSSNNSIEKRVIQKLSLENDYNNNNNWIMSNALSKDNKLQSMLQMNSDEDFKSLYSGLEPNRSQSNNPIKSKASPQKNERMLLNQLRQDLQDIKVEKNELVQAFSKALKNLQDSSIDFIHSSNKLMRFIPRNGTDVEAAIKVYENDRAILEECLSDLDTKNIPSRDKNSLQERESINPKKYFDPKQQQYAYKADETISSPDTKYILERKTKSMVHTSNLKQRSALEEFERLKGDVMQIFETGAESHGRYKDTRSSEKKHLNSRMTNGHDTLSTTNENLIENLVYENKVLQQELALFKEKYDKMMNQSNKDEKSMGGMQKGLLSSEYETNNNSSYIQELTDRISKLANENLSLTHLLKKFERKCEERKRNLKKMFNLINEKEKELEYYRSNSNKSIVKTQALDLDKMNMFSPDDKKAYNNNNLQDEEEHIMDLRYKIQERDQDIMQMIQIIEWIFMNWDNNTKNKGLESSEKASRFFDTSKDSLQIEEMVYNLKTITLQKKKDLHALIKKMTQRNESKYDFHTFGTYASIQVSSSTTNNNQNTMPEDKKEMMLLLEKNQELNSDVQILMSDKENLKECNKQYEKNLQELTNELEMNSKKYNELYTDYKKLQDQSMKMEKVYNENTSLMTIQIRELNQYILTLENQIKSRAVQDLDDSKISFSKNQEEEKLNMIFEVLQIPKDQYKNLDSSSKLSKIYTKITELMMTTIAKDQHQYHHHNLQLETNKTRYISPSKSISNSNLDISTNKSFLIGQGRGVSPSQIKDTSPFAYQRTNEMLSQEILMLKKTNKDLENLLSDYKEEINMKLEENEELLARLKEREDEITQLTELKKPNTTNESLQNMKSLDNSRYNKLQDEIDKIIYQLSSFAIKYKIISEEEIPDTVYRLIEIIEKAYQDLLRFKEEFATNNRFEDSRNLSMKNSELIKMNGNLKNELEVCKNSLKQQELILADLDGKYKSLQNSKDEIDHKLRQKDLEMDKLNKDLNKKHQQYCQAIIDEYDKRIKSSEEEKSRLIKQCTEFESALKAKHAALVTQQDNVKNQNEILRDLENLRQDNVEKSRLIKETNAICNVLKERLNDVISLDEDLFKEDDMKNIRSIVRNQEGNLKVNIEVSEMNKDKQELIQLIEELIEEFGMIKIKKFELAETLQFLKENLQAKEVELTESINLNEELRNENVKMNEDNQRLMDKLLEKETVITRNEDDMVKKQEEIKKLEEIIMVSNEKLTKFSSQIDGLQKLTKNTNEENEKLKGMLYNQREEHKKVNESNEKLQNSIENLENEKLQMLQMIENLEEKLGKQTEEGNILQSDYSSLHNEYEKVQNDFHEYKRNFETSILKKNTEINELKSQLERLKESKDIAKGYKDLLKENEGLMKKNQDLMQKNEDLVNEKEDLVKQNNDMVKKNEDLVKKNEDLMTKNEDLVNKSQNLVNEDLAKKNEELVKKNQESTKKNQDLVNENEDLMNKNQDLVTENEDLVNKNQDLVNENEDLAKKNQDLMNENEDLMNKNQGLVKKSEDLMKKNEDLVKKSENLVKKNEEIMKKNKELMKRLDDLSSANENLNEKYELIRQENEEFRVALEDRQKEIVEKGKEAYEMTIKDKEDMILRLEGYERQMNEWKEKSEMIEKINEEMQNDLANKDELIEQLQSELETAQTELENVQTELENTQTELENTRTELENGQRELEKAQEELHIGQKEIENMKKELETANTEVENIHRELESTQVKLETTQKELGNIQNDVVSKNRLIEQLKNDLNDVQTNLLNKDASIEQLKKALNDSQTNLEDKTKLIDGLQGKLSEIQEELESKDQLISNLKKELNEIQHDVMSKDEMIEKLKAAIKGEKADTNVLIEQLQNELNDLQSEKENKDRVIEKLQNELNEIQNDMVEKDGYIEQLQAELNDLKANMADNDALIEQLQNELNILKGHLAKKDGLIKELKIELQCVQNDNMEKDELIEQFQQELNEIQNDIEDKVGLLKQVQYELDGAQHDLIKKDEEIKQLHDELGKAQEDMEDKIQLIEKLTKDQKGLEAKGKNELETLNAKISQLLDERSKEASKLGDMEAELKMKTMTMAKNDKEIDNLKKQIGILTNEVSQVQEALRKSENEKDEVISSKEEMKKGFEQKVMSLNKKSKEDENVIHEKILEIEELKAELQGVKDEYDEFQRRNKILLEESSSLKEKTSSDYESLLQQNNANEMEIFTLQKKLKTQEQTITTLNIRIDELSLQLKDIEGQLEDSLLNNTEKDKMIEECKGFIKKVNIELANSQSMIEKQKVNYDEFIFKIKDCLKVIEEKVYKALKEVYLQAEQENYYPLDRARKLMSGHSEVLGQMVRKLQEKKVSFGEFFSEGKDKDKVMSISQGGLSMDDKASELTGGLLATREEFYTRIRELFSGDMDDKGRLDEVIEIISIGKMVNLEVLGQALKMWMRNSQISKSIPQDKSKLISRIIEQVSFSSDRRTLEALLEAFGDEDYTSNVFEAILREIFMIGDNAFIEDCIRGFSKSTGLIDLHSFIGELMGRVSASADSADHEVNNDNNLEDEFEKMTGLIEKVIRNVDSIALKRRSERSYWDKVIKRLGEMNTELVNEIRDYEKMVKEVKKEENEKVKNWNRLVEEANSKSQIQEKELEDCHIQINELKQQIEKHKLEISGYKSELEKITIENNEKSKLNEKIKKELESRIAEYTLKYDEIKHELDLTKSNIKNYDQEIAKLNQIIHEKAEKFSDLEMNLAKKAKENRDLDALLNEKADYENKIHVKDEEISKLLAADLLMKDRIKKLEHLIKEYKNREKNHEDLIKELENQASEHKYFIKEYDTRVQDHESEIEQLKEELKILKEELNSSRASLEDHENEIMQLKRELDQAYDEIDKLQMLNVDKADEKDILESYKKENMQLLDKLDKANKDLSKLEEANLQMKQELSKLRKSDSAMKEEANSVQYTNLAMTKEITQLKSENFILREEISKLKSSDLAMKEKVKSDYEEKIASLTRELGDFEKENTRLKDELNQAYEDIYKLQTSNLNLGDKLDQEEDLNMLREDNSKLNDKLEEMTQVNNELIERVDLLEKKVNDLQDMNHELKAKKEDLIKVNMELEKDIEELGETSKNEMQNFMRQIDNLEVLNAESMALKNKYKGLEVERDGLLERCRCLGDDLANEKEKEVKLSRFITTIQGELKSFVEYINQNGFSESKLQPKIELVVEGGEERLYGLFESLKVDISKGNKALQEKVESLNERLVNKEKDALVKEKEFKEKMAQLEENYKQEVEKHKDMINSQSGTVNELLGILVKVEALALGLSEESVRDKRMISIKSGEYKEWKVLIQDKLKEMKDELERGQHEDEEGNEKILAEMKRNKDQITNLLSKLEEIQVELDKKQAKLQEKQVELDEKQAELDKQQIELQEKQVQLKEKQAELEEKHLELEESRIELENKQNEIEILKAQNGMAIELRQNLTNSQKELKVREEEFNRLSLENKELKKKIGTMEEEIKDIRVANEKWQNKNFESIQETQRLEEEVNELRKKLNDNVVFHEKGALKIMIFSFMDCLEQHKDGSDFLKKILSMVDCTEKEKSDYMKKYENKPKKGFWGFSK